MFWGKGYKVMTETNMDEISNSVLKAYNKIAEKYVTAYEQNDLTDCKFLDDFVALLNDNKVLDMGCGCGESISYLANFGLDIIGIDFSESMLAEARRRYPTLKFEKQNILNTSFEDKSFDGIVLTYVINHFNDMGLKSLKEEIDRLLKDGGLVFLSFHVGNEEKYVTDPLDDTIEIYYNFLNLDDLDKLFEGYKRIKSNFRESFGPEEFLCDKMFVIFRKD